MDIEMFVGLFEFWILSFPDPNMYDGTLKSSVDSLSSIL